MVDVEEELQAELVEEVYLVQRLDGEVDVGAGRGEGVVLPRRVLDFRHNLQETRFTNPSSHLI